MTRSQKDLDELYRLGGMLSDVENLTAVLQIVCWQLCQQTIQNKSLSEIRNAVIGIGNALETVLAEAAPDGDANQKGEAV